MANRRDPLTVEQRSETMRRVRRKNTKPELALRKELYRRGLRYRVDYAGAPGRPDIALVGRKLAIFVDGEFWHGKKLSEERLSEMSEYWQHKIPRNVERDAGVNDRITACGWSVIRATDRGVAKNLDEIADFVEAVANGNGENVCPAGIEWIRAQR
ncbi:MAG: very short patch repair endonuclease [Chloroflexi bacterium]|nr:very short patch repair endonuclease [Chloroflexota bacterium]